jgi:hypothetical protein
LLAGIMRLINSFSRLVFLFSAIGIMAGCNDLDGASRNDVSVVISHAWEEYNVGGEFNIGEPLLFAINIENQGDPVVEIINFASREHEIAFSNPDGLHLIDPSGQDLLAPYRNGDANNLDQNGSPITIEPGQNYARALPIHTHLFLNEPGQYTFWAELEDSSGNMYKRNELQFDLIDINASAPSDLIDLTLMPDEISFHVGDRWDIQIAFTNNSTEPLTFLEERELSPTGLRNPIYRYVAGDETGRGLPLPSTDFGAEDEITRFTLQPGESHQFSEHMPRFPDMRRTGVFKVQLTYMVRNNLIEYGFVTDQPMNWEDDVFVGRLVSNEITVIIQK